MDLKKMKFMFNKFKTFTVFQLSSILITSFYIFILILDFTLTVNKKLLFSYYKKIINTSNIFIYFWFIIYFFSSSLWIIIEYTFD